MKRNAKEIVTSRPCTIRCAIYTRKSTEEGLQQEFNSLDAQRDFAEKYIASQHHEGWVCLPERYDDGGYTGANAERPALKRLFDDIRSRRVDCVVVYKVDRLSRSFIDFAHILELFDEHQVAFVSVTQPFNTSTPMGRFVLSMLCNFAQFERETISERTRDKVAAARRKGKWSGGMPVLGYDVDSHTKLVVNHEEAQRVRAIFELYLDYQSLIATARALNDKGWTTKRWTTRAGEVRGGQLFDKARLFRLLTNVVYLGQVRYKEEIHPGEHQAIVEESLFQRVQALLRSNGRTGGMEVRNKYGALLKGILVCKPCARAMTHTYTTKGNRAYRYYVCQTAHTRGWDACPSKSIPAEQIEKFVVERIRTVGTDPDIMALVLEQARQRADVETAQLEGQIDDLQRELQTLNAEIMKVAPDAAVNEHAAFRLVDLHERNRIAEERQAGGLSKLEKLRITQISKGEVDSALAAFTPLWGTLSPREQARVLQLLVQRVEYDGAKGKVTVTFHSNGIRTLDQGVASTVETNECTAA